MPPLLFLHGALGSAAQLRPLHDAVRTLAGDAVVMHDLDFEGHGDAVGPGRPFRIAHFTENVSDLLDRLGIERASVFGYSMGGYVGLALAATTPRRVDRVMTLGTKFRWTPDVAEREGRMLDPVRMASKVPQFVQALESRHAAVGWTHVVNGTREMMQALGDHPLLDDAVFERLDLPVRIAVGDRDATVPVEECVGVVRRLPQGELEVLPGVPHPFERLPIERVARSIVEFLARE